LLLAMTMTMAMPAGAQYLAGAGLNEACTAPVQSFGAGLCIGYVAGVVDSGDSCVPGHISLGAIRERVREYLESYPRQHKYTAESLVRRALAQAFPCED